MTTNKPEVVAWIKETWRSATESRPVVHDWEGNGSVVSPLVRLSDYEALQAEFVIRLDELSARNYELRMGLAEKTSECEQLRKDAAAALNDLPDSLPMEPYQTVDRGSPHYKAGWNACRRAMLAAQKEEISRALQYRDAHFEALLQALEQVDAMKAECEELRKDAELWESIHDEIHRRADKEHALADRCDFDVTIMYEDYAAIDAAMAGGDQ